MSIKMRLRLWDASFIEAGFFEEAFTHRVFRALQNNICRRVYFWNYYFGHLFYKLNLASFQSKQYEFNLQKLGE